METLELPAAEQAADTEWGAVAPDGSGEQDLDILVYEMWRRAYLPASADRDETPRDEELLRAHASCL